MRFKVLIENTTKMDCPVEHGLSLYIETDRHHILFDTGQTELFAENAERFGVDLKSVDLCILSHGHY
ncbi:MAG: MBL fold metallo-hydrolase, partial [Lachnospiraceae bacterium]